MYKVIDSVGETLRVFSTYKEAMCFKIVNNRFDRTIMKTMFIVIAMLFSVNVINAQSVQREGDTFSSVKADKEKTPDTQTKYTWKDSKGKSYPVYVSKNGSFYIMKIAKSGKEYKSYLPKDVQEIMRKELGIKKESK